MRKRFVLLILLLLTACAEQNARFFTAQALPQGLRVAILPLVNYTEDREASDRLIPALALQLQRRGFRVADAGEVEQVLAVDPWLAADRLPADLVDRFGEELHVDALVVGTVLAFGYRPGDNPPVPEVSLTLKFIETPGGRCLWSGVHSRDGSDREHVFGIGRVESLEQLADETVAELAATLPVDAPLAIVPPTQERQP
jgi:hypothetical protein